MSKIYKSTADLIGNTPLFELTNIEKKLGLEAKIVAKLEYFNPAGSVKDRIAKEIIEQAEKAGKIKPGAVLIEPTSGNTGIGIASIAASKGYRAILTMPETMSVERRNILKAYGAEIVLTDGAKGMKGAIAKAEELAKEIENSFIPSQFDNPANPEAHFKTTGPEIWNDTDGNVDYFIAGVGTGGTLSGTGEYLKQQNKLLLLNLQLLQLLARVLLVHIRFRVLVLVSFQRTFTMFMMKLSLLRMKMLSNMVSLFQEKKVF